MEHFKFGGIIAYSLIPDSYYSDRSVVYEPVTATLLA
jgi:hypothetical protein